MHEKTKELRVLDLFSGIGGFSLGLKRAGGFRTVCYVEIEPYCQEVLKARMQDGSLDMAPIWDDVAKFDGKPWRGHVDLICGGFPCQDISLAGRGAGIKGERSGLWGQYARVIREIQPRFVLVENVAALLARGLGDVLGDLAESRYDAEWDCIPASAVGANHRRDRVWILAHAKRGRPWRAECAYATTHHEVGDLAAHQPRGFPEPSKAGASGKDVADAFGYREPQPEGSVSHKRGRFINGGKEMAHPNKEGLKVFQGGDAIPQLARYRAFCGSGWWSFEPDVGRVAHGIPSRVDRLKALGNAVVPQVVEWIGRRIRESMNAE